MLKSSPAILKSFKSNLAANAVLVFGVSFKSISDPLDQFGRPKSTLQIKSRWVRFLLNISQTDAMDKFSAMGKTVKVCRE